MLSQLYADTKLVVKYSLSESLPWMVAGCLAGAVVVSHAHSGQLGAHTVKLSAGLGASSIGVLIGVVGIIFSVGISIAEALATLLFPFKNSNPLKSMVLFGGSLTLTGISFIAFGRFASSAFLS